MTQYGLFAALMALVFAYGSSVLADAGQVSLRTLLGAIGGQWTSTIDQPQQPADQ